MRIDQPATFKSNEGKVHASMWIGLNSNTVFKLRKLFRNYYLHHGRELPWRITTDPYIIFVAEVLLQKTAARQVIHIWNDFIDTYPNINAIAQSQQATLLKAIHYLGLEKRASMLHRAAKIIVRKFSGSIPKNREELEKLPGIGSYSSAAILSFAYGDKAAIVDANVVRVYTRICGFSPQTRRQGLKFANILANKIVTKYSHKEINYGLLDFAAQICKPKPSCSSCPAYKFCAYSTWSKVDN